MHRVPLLAFVWIVFFVTSARAEDLVLSGSGGRLELVSEEKTICVFTPMAADVGWKQTWGRTGEKDRFLIDVGDGKLAGELAVKDEAGAVQATWVLTAEQDVSFQTLVMEADFRVGELGGGRWAAGGREGEFPKVFGGAMIFGGKVKELTLTFPDGRVLGMKFSEELTVFVQDNRQWGEGSYSIRIGRGDGRMAGGEAFTIGMALSFGEGLRYSVEEPEFRKPVTIVAGEDWIPLTPELEIAEGSALDLSKLGGIDGPCGSKGRVIVTADGHFAYAKEPEKARRFYGVNLCFGAQFLSKEQVDRLLDRLVRLGYNSVRIHHYERDLIDPKDASGLAVLPERQDELDYLMAGCAKRGLWLTTDAYVSRPVRGEQIGRGEGNLSMDDYKRLVPVSDGAFENWKAFTRKFLDRVNPYTGVRVADDPALAWLSLVNEGPLSLGWDKLKEMPEWQAAWKEWLGRKFATRDELAAAAGGLDPQEDRDTMAMPPVLIGTAPREQLAQAFLVEMESRTYERMRDFLRNEVKCEALLTNMNNAGSMMVPLQAVRAGYDYVDEHFYVDHPSFLEKMWKLPSRSPNTNPVEGGAPQGVQVASVRVYGKPFVITEYNYTGPGRFRGLGGILTGALAGLQNWDAVWRFAYGHTRESLFEAGRMGYFDLVTDPLNQAADRMTLFLYLRGDLKPAPTRIATVLRGEELRQGKLGTGLSVLQSGAWVAQIGSVVLKPGEAVPDGYVALPEQPEEARTAMGTELGKLTAAGEVALKGGQLTIDTPRSAGGYAEPGEAIRPASEAVVVDEVTTGATVFVNSLDAAPIKESRRLLVTHLTDLQNTGIRYKEKARQTLLDWGGMPYLVRSGAARVSIAVAKPEGLAVWALSLGGRRLGKVESRVENGRLIFTANVKGGEGARMLYEVAEESR